MDDNRNKNSAAEAEVERQTRLGRKFTPEEAVARLAGPGAMKGASPVSPMLQAETEVGCWLRSHFTRAGDALPQLLHRHLKGSELLLNNLDQPLIALAGYCSEVLASDYLLRDLVREADVEWGQTMGERPRFEREGFPEQPDDPYTVESVRKALDELLRQLTSMK